MTDCLFCKIIAGEIPSHNIYEDDRVIVFLDIRPINPGHALIVPKSHAADLRESSVGDVCYAMEIVKKLAPAILKTVGADAFNFSANTGAAAGQAVFHTHFHVMPRFDGDGYKPWTREGAADDLASVAERIRANL